MNRGAKQNWFESPLSKNGVWLFHDDKIDLFNFSRIGSQQRFSFLTPSNQSKSYEFERNFKQHPLSHNENENCKFEDINLPDMFTNTIIERQVINEKLNFEESSIISQEHDYQTPSRYGEHGNNLTDFVGKELPQTAVKQGNACHQQQKKPRPKEKGLRMLSQKAYEIVTKMNGATYKQVAQCLVDDLKLEETVEIERKDQQNIKRRVYDALNVLIALGILNKKERRIHGSRNKTPAEEAKKEEYKRAFIQNQLKRARIQQKTKKLKELKQQRQFKKALIKRNKLFPSSDHIINFPYLAYNVDHNDENNITVRKNCVQIQSSLKNVHPIGDMDTILHLRPSLRNYFQSSHH